MTSKTELVEQLRAKVAVAEPEGFVEVHVDFLSAVADALEALTARGEPEPVDNFCEACAGTGFKLYSRRDMLVTFDMATDCPECDGKGTP